MAHSFVQLSLNERRIIACMCEQNISQSEIVISLGRNRSTVSGAPLTRCGRSAMAVSARRQPACDR